MSMMPTSRSIEQDYFQQAHEQYHQLINTLSAEDTQGWEHGEVERYINEDGNRFPRPGRPLLPPPGVQWVNGNVKK